jgi:hypothetical protein
MGTEVAITLDILHVKRLPADRSANIGYNGAGGNPMVEL